MGNEMDRPHLRPPHGDVPPGFSMPKEATTPRLGDDGVHDRRSWWTRVRAWFAKEPGRHDSYVSNVTNPDDRRFIPRR
jgi:hypothetical protein